MGCGKRSAFGDMRLTSGASHVEWDGCIMCEIPLQVEAALRIAKPELITKLCVYSHAFVVLDWP
jgi:hypothetical protein